MAILAIENGKHVILEKPIGISFEDLSSLFGKSEESGVHVAVTLQNRYNPTSIYLKKIVDSGEYGVTRNKSQCYLASGLQLL